MIVLGKDKLERFTARHADSRRALERWVTDAERENWRTPQDIKNAYRSADFLAGNRVIFNIRGNHYRLVVKVRYSNGMLLIEWVAPMQSTTRWSFEYG